MEKPEFKPEMRLVFQGSIPFELPENAETFYELLKSMVKSQSEKSTFNGQIMKMLEPCCNKGVKTP